MTLVDTKNFSDWDTFYRENKLETMPWFFAKLDEDLKDAIDRLGINGGDFLDLGTGPGTQAVELQKIGFNTTGSDISEYAVNKAQNLDATFVVDDILDSRLQKDGFDYILDRGCFHVFDSEKHLEYIKNIKKILRPNGYLFLKCMSIKETNLPEDKGPYRYSQEQIREIFSASFDIQDVKETVYYGTLDPLPKAIFFVMRKK